MLLKAVLENPEEDTPRLMYADWLDEAPGGRLTKRADFIRTQIRLSQIREPINCSPAPRLGCGCEACSLRSRERYLMGTYDAFRTPDQPRIHLPRSGWIRGFCEEPVIDWIHWQTTGDMMMLYHPVRIVSLTEELRPSWVDMQKFSPDSDGLFGHPYWPVKFRFVRRSLESGRYVLDAARDT